MFDYDGQTLSKGIYLLDEIYMVLMKRNTVLMKRNELVIFVIQKLIPRQLNLSSPC